MDNEVIANYSFLPWMKKGLSRKVDLVDKQDGIANQLERAEISVKITVDVEAPNVDQFVTKGVQLIGPGDIVGIHTKSIARVEPAEGSETMEPNYMPYLEFYEEDFPWRYTPAMPDATIEDGKRHTPWMTLLVLTDVEAEYNVNPGGTLPTVKVLDQAVLPDCSTLWGFAHVHVATNLDAEADKPGKIDILRKENPDTISSRLLCPRRLDENTTYRAYLVPTFLTGALAGTDGDPSTEDALTFSWPQQLGVGPIYLPVYHTWEFTTTANGDFEQLVRRLNARPADPAVGSRKMDIRKVGPGMNEISDPNHILGIDTEFFHIGGALRTPATVPYTWETAQDQLDWDDQLTLILNQSSENQGPGSWNGAGPSWSGSGDPVVTPPLYGRWHSLQKEVPTNTNSWVRNVNLDPGNRAAAGLGSSVIRKDQEEYVDRSWKQVGAVLAANQLIRAAILAKEASYSYFTRVVEKLSDDVFMTATSRLQPRTLVDNVGATAQQSAKARVKESNLPVAMQSIAVRKVTNRNARIAKKANSVIQSITTGELEKQLVEKLNDQTKTAITAAEPKVDPIQFLDTSSQLASFSTYVTAIQNGTQTNQALSVNSGSNGVTNYNAFQEIENYYTTVSNPAPKPELDISGVRTAIETKINPLTAIGDRVASVLKQDGVVSPICDPILAEPRIGDAMYEKLRAISSDFIIPNIDKIQDETISLLETNPDFIESYMVGLNHEMARELLWREYPTDQRGTYFTQFWNKKDQIKPTFPPTSPNQESDIAPISTWAYDTPLGDPTHRNSGATSSSLVLLVRGELLRKYPNAVIYARPADLKKDGNGVIDPGSTEPREYLDPAPEMKYPTFRATVDPDITLFGFDLTAEEAVGDAFNTGNPGPYPDPNFQYAYPGGWYFIIQEREGDVRFGLDVITGSPGTITDWNDLSWQHITVGANGYFDPSDGITPGIATTLSPSYNDSYNLIDWGSNAADLAYTLYQPPVAVGVHGMRLLYGLI